MIFLGQSSLGTADNSAGTVSDGDKHALHGGLGFSSVDIHSVWDATNPETIEKKDRCCDLNESLENKD